jgi:hypothetical protein
MRELSDQAVLDQARQLYDYVKRGGAASRWLDSKSLDPEDRGRVLRAWWRVEEEHDPLQTS